ncbi:MAG TPA: histidinol-phosphatase, partial [Chloroflexota bacterium]|nr:histidinol-phosphatase [Chloroflexota bacterium]
MNTTRLENRGAARTMFAIASLLEAQGANPYRVRAYRQAGLHLMRLPEQAADLTSTEGQLLVPWLGDRLRRKVGELGSRGKMQFHQELLAEFPRAFRQLMAVPGVGPKTAERLIREMEIKSVLGLAR